MAKAAAGGLAVALLALALPAAGQDRRTVTEPRFPERVCARLAPDSSANEAARLQAALAACPAGAAVQLVPGPAGGDVPTGPLVVPPGVSLWLASGVRLRAIPDPALFDRGAGTCGMIDTKGGGCRPLLSLSGRGSGLYGPGTIDGQGGAVMAGRDETWWQMARRAQGIGGAQNAPRLVQIDQAEDVTLYRLRLTDAPNFHVAMDGVKGVTAWGLVIDTPADARNTDCIDPGSAEDVTIAHSFIRTGDDDVAIKAGPAGPSAHLSILDTHIYSGHGMSIGSQLQAGVRDVLVRGLSLDGTTWGLRIKSGGAVGGSVTGVRYQDVCLRANRWPISLTADYGGKVTGAMPRYSGIDFVGVTGQGGRLVIAGADPAHPVVARLDGLRFGPEARWQVANARLSGADVVPAPPAMAPAAGRATPPDCSARFPPFPSAP